MEYGRGFVLRAMAEVQFHNLGFQGAVHGTSSARNKETVNFLGEYLNFECKAEEKLSPDFLARRSGRIDGTSLRCIGPSLSGSKTISRICD
jgi:hypothetical protein